MPQALAERVLGAESGGDPHATSKTGAQGLMQLEPGTAKEMGVTDAFDPTQNINGGIKYLGQLLKRYSGNVTLALAAYNAGPGAVDKYKGVPPFPETQAYVAQIVAGLSDPIVAPASAATPAPSGPAHDPGFQAYFKKYGKNWDPVDAKGVSGGYNLYEAYKLGLKPDSAGHLPSVGPKGEVLKTGSDPRTIVNGVDTRTGYQVAPPTYTGPMTPEIMKNAAKYLHAGTARRQGGPGAWDDIPNGQSRPPATPPAGYAVTQ